MGWKSKTSGGKDSGYNGWEKSGNENEESQEEADNGTDEGDSVYLQLALVVIIIGDDQREFMHGLVSL